jgi:putative aldouronate transport system substrate-binding protein
MLNLKKAMCLGVAIILCLSFMLAGCGDKKEQNEVQQTKEVTGEKKEEVSQEETSEPELEPYDLKYYALGTPQSDIDLVNAEMTKMLKEKINATFEMTIISWGDWQNKMNVILASGEEFDMTFTCPWAAPTYYQAVANGAFLPLDDLLEKYAPKTKALVPDYVWDAGRIDGKIYGVNNYQIMAMAYGPVVDQAILDKYNFDITKVTKLADLEPLLEAAKNGGDLKNGICTSDTIIPLMCGYDAVGDASVGWVKMGDSSLKVVNQFETQEYKDFLKLQYDWHKKGYIRKDIVTAIKNSPEDINNGKYIAKVVMNIKPNADEELSAASKVGTVWKSQAITKPLVTTDRAIATMTAISKTSGNPERAMMCIELLNTDEKIFNTLAIGIENTHWVKTGDRQIDFAPGLDSMTSGYYPNTAWMFGRQALAYYWPNEKVGIWDECEQLNKEAEASPLLGFNYDPEPVSSESAKISAVLTELSVPLSTGGLDPDEYLPKLLERLKNAGADKVIAEKQRQLDQWLASK